MMKDNSSILKPFLRGMPIIILAMIIGVLVAQKYLNYVTPMYESTAKIKLADKGDGTPGSNLFKDLDVFVSSNKIAAEIEILKSEVLMSKVIATSDFNLEIFRVGKIKTVELYHNSPLLISYNYLTQNAIDNKIKLVVLNKNEFTIQLQAAGKPMLAKMGSKIKTDYGIFTIALNDLLLKQNSNMQIVGEYEFEILSNQKLYEKILKNLDIISVDKDVAVVRINYKDASPIKAAQLVNKLSEVYIQDYIEAKYKAANITVNFLNEQINAVMKKVSASENEIETYRNDNSITNINQETETDLRKISQLKIQQTNLKMSLEAIQDLDKYIRNGKDNFLELAPNFEAFTDLLSTEMIKKVKALQAEKKDLLITYTKDNEKVKVIDEKIEDITSYLIESIKNTRQNLEVKYNNLCNDIKIAESAFIGIPEKEKMLNILNREFNLYQQSYNFLNEKRIEAEIAQSAKISFHRIISNAEIAKKPVSPNRIVIIIISAILAMFIAIMCIFLVHKLKAKVNDVNSIETNSNIAIAALTPKLLTPKSILNHFIKEAIELELKGLYNSNSVLCLTDYQNNEGASFNAYHLAIAMQTQGRKVLLIDADNQLNKFTSNNMNDVLVCNGVDICTLINPKFNAYTQGKMNAHFAEFKNFYDVVIVINESLANGIKSKMIMKVSDTNLLVLDTRLTAEKRILESDLLQLEYKFDKLFFMINRYAYNPSLSKQILKKIIAIRSKKK